MTSIVLSEKRGHSHMRPTHLPPVTLCLNSSIHSAMDNVKSDLRCIGTHTRQLRENSEHRSFIDSGQPKRYFVMHVSLFFSRSDNRQPLRYRNSQLSCQLQSANSAALLVSCLASFLTPFMGSALNVARADYPRVLPVVPYECEDCLWYFCSTLCARTVFISRARRYSI
jgi:hypothetical protein